MSAVPPNFNKNSNNSTGGFYTSNTPSIINKPINAIFPYDIEYAYLQQSQKNNDKTLRFSMSIQADSNNTYDFQAHVDPNHLIDEQGKRFVELPVLTGTVLQDFGYTPEKIELRGTTGSAYYREIELLDDIFNNQSIKGVPTSVKLNIEHRNYNCYWDGFIYDRQQTPQGGNLINYTMNFIVLNRNSYSSTDPNNSATNISHIASNMALKNNQQFNNNSAVTKNVQTNGLSTRQYLKALPQVPNSRMSIALNFVRNNWNIQINGETYPGDDIVLQQNQVLTIPVDWNTILN